MYYIVRKIRGRCVRGMVPGGGHGRASGRGHATPPLDNGTVVMLCIRMLKLLKCCLSLYDQTVARQHKKVK